MTSPLGDKFPLQYRKQFCDRHLKKGAVLRFIIDFTEPPKIKRLVVLGVNERLGRVAVCVINTEINPNVLRTKELRDLQLTLESHGRFYLDHDSYLDCSKIFERDLQFIRNKIIADMGVYLDQMSDVDIRSAEAKISSARTIPVKLKKRYGFLL